MRYRFASTACVRHRSKEGKTNREIIRCLRRYLAPEIYRYLLRGQIPPPSRPEPLHRPRTETTSMAKGAIRRTKGVNAVAETFVATRE